MGKILSDSGSKDWIEVADNLDYTTALVLLPIKRRLCVSETVGNCILKFDINPDGSLSHRANFCSS